MTRFFIIDFLFLFYFYFVNELFIGNSTVQLELSCFEILTSDYLMFKKFGETLHGPLCVVQSIILSSFLPKYVVYLTKIHPLRYIPS